MHLICIHIDVHQLTILTYILHWYCAHEQKAYGLQWTGMHVANKNVTFMRVVSWLVNVTVYSEMSCMCVCGKFANIIKFRPACNNKCILFAEVGV